jgi:hypothetical protein
VYKDPDCNEGYPMVFISKNQAVDECCEEKEGVHEVEIIKKHKGGKK